MAIELHGVLPEVFAAQQAERRIAESQVWLSDVTFSEGSTYLVEAVSGAGKSSLCSFLYGNRNDYQGDILFDGTDIRSLSISQWCRTRCEYIALLPQEMRLFPELTTMENIEIKNRLTACKSSSQIVEMLSRLEIDDKIDTPVARLSVGQQQRVAIVRALCQPMRFLLLDEPVSHLDSRCNRLVASLIADEARRQGAGVIATSVGNQIELSFDHVLKM